MADQIYIEDGYLETGYFERVVDVQIGSNSGGDTSEPLVSSFSLVASVEIADTTGYYIPDYIEEGYYALPVSEAEAEISSQATLTVDIDRVRSADTSVSVTTNQQTTVGRITQGIVNIDSAFTPSVTALATKTGDILMVSQTNLESTASKFSGNEATLDNIVNLSLQGDRSRDTSSLITTVSQLSVDVEKTAGFSATLNANFVPTVLLTTNVAANLNVETQLVANAISYQTKTLTNGRPNNFVGYNYDGSANSWSVDNRGIAYTNIFPSEIYGEYRLHLDAGYGLADDNPGAAAAFDSISLTSNEDFYFSVQIDRKYDGTVQSDGTSSNSRNIFASVGNGFNTVIEISNETYTIDDNGAINIGFYRIGSDGIGNDIMVPYAKVGTLELYDTNWNNGSNFQLGQLTVRRVNGTVYFEYNRNGLIDSGTYTGSLNNLNQVSLYAAETYRNLEPNFDRVIFKIGDGGDGDNYYSIVPSDENTYVYATFEQTLDDITTLTQDAQATINAQVTQSTDANVIATANSSISSTVDLTTDTNVLLQTSSNLQVNAQQQTQAVRIKQLDSSVFVTTQTTASANVVRDINLTLSAKTAQNATPTRIKQFASEFDSIAISTNVVNKIGNTLVSLDNTTTLDSTAVKTTDTQSSLIAQTTQTAEAIRIQPLSADLAATTQSSVDVNITSSSVIAAQTTTALEATVGVIKPFEAQFSSITIGVNTVNKIGNTLVSLDNTTTLGATATSSKEFNSAIESNSTLTATPNIIKDVDSAISANVAQTATADRFAEFASNINTQVVQTATIRKTANFDVDIASAWAAQMTVRAIRNNELDIYAQTQLTANVDRKRGAVSSFVVNTQTVAITNRIAKAEATINAQIAVAADGKLLVLPQELTYVIPRETREYQILAENREHVVIGG